MFTMQQLKATTPQVRRRRQALPIKSETQVIGRWYETPVTCMNQWEGVCGRCGQVVPAVKLVNVLLPFGKGEVWACKQGC